MRVSTAFNRLLALPGGTVSGVSFAGGHSVVVDVRLRARRLSCPQCRFTTAARYDTRPVSSSWRHTDLGRWQVIVRAGLRRLWCPTHGVRVEAVGFARYRAGFTRDFEDLVVRHEASLNRVGCRAPPPGCRSGSVKRGAA